MHVRFKWKFEHSAVSYFNAFNIGSASIIPLVFDVKLSNIIVSLQLLHEQSTCHTYLVTCVCIQLHPRLASHAVWVPCHNINMSTPAIIHAVDLQKLKGLLDSGVLDLDAWVQGGEGIAAVQANPGCSRSSGSCANAVSSNSRQAWQEGGAAQTPAPSTSTTKVIAPKAKMLCAHAA